MTNQTVTINSAGMTAADVIAVARHDAKIVISAEALAGMAKTRSTSITIPPDLRQWLESQTRYGFGIGAVIRHHLLLAMAKSDAKR